MQRGSSAFTLNNRTKALQKMSSKAKIANLRNHFGNLINATDNKQDQIQNPFMPKDQGLNRKSSHTGS